MIYRMQKFLNDRNWHSLRDGFLTAVPFNHVVIDDFFCQPVAEALAREFPAHDDPVWPVHYNNAIENKKACNHWDRFPRMTYDVFHFLCGERFVDVIRSITGNTDIQCDFGLHGGGWHSHSTAGYLNLHLDYSRHPKLDLYRKYNLLVYLSSEWDPAWGGALQLWSSDQEGQPNGCEQVIEPRFNRAVLFDTTQRSWHGLPDAIACPAGQSRQSLAVYYLSSEGPADDQRGKALFAARPEQANDPAVKALIHSRSQSSQ